MVVVDPEKIEWEPVENPKAPSKGMWGNACMHVNKTDRSSAHKKRGKVRLSV